MGEQGVYLGSTKGTLVVQNQFARFGDAALRMTTASQDRSIPPGSMAIKVSHNHFEDCAQVTTTQATAGTEMPGTQDIIIDNNQFNACKLKLSARADTRELRSLIINLKTLMVLQMKSVIILTFITQETHFQISMGSLSTFTQTLERNKMFSGETSPL